MYQSAFTSSKDLLRYDSLAYNAFASQLRNRKADWLEFLPNADTYGHNAILLKIKTLEHETHASYNIPNPKIYSLKNEHNAVYSYGFNFTDLFSTYSFIADKFYANDQLHVYQDAIQSSGEVVNVIEFTESVKGQAQTFLKHLSVIGKGLSVTATLLAAWNNSLGEQDRQELMQAFGLYITTLFDTGEINTQYWKNPYNWFYQIENSESVAEVVEKLAVFNIDFEKLITGFQQFFVAINRQKGQRPVRNSAPVKISRQMFID